MIQIGKWARSHSNCWGSLSAISQPPGFAGCGFQTFVVADGSAAISRAMQLAPDLIITTCKTPGLCGKDLLWSEFPATGHPVIVVAAPGWSPRLSSVPAWGCRLFNLHCAKRKLSSVGRILKQEHERRERDGGETASENQQNGRSGA